MIKYSELEGSWMSGLWTIFEKSMFSREVPLRLSMFSKNAFVTPDINNLTRDKFYLCDNTYPHIF